MYERWNMYQRNERGHSLQSAVDKGDEKEEDAARQS
jgi:hypothetical protein